MDKNIEAALIILAEKLGTTTDSLWSVLINQAVLTGIMNAAEALVYLTVCTVAGIWLKKWWENSRDPEYELLFPLLIWGVVSLSVSVYTVISFKFLITAVLNPEYAALMLLSDLFSK